MWSENSTALQFMKNILFTVHDLLEFKGFTGSRLCEIVGIHLGAYGQQDVIEIVSLDKTDPVAHGYKQIMLVPREMLCAGIEAHIFNHTPIAQLDAP